LISYDQKQYLLQSVCLHDPPFQISTTLNPPRCDNDRWSTSSRQDYAPTNETIRACSGRQGGVITVFCLLYIIIPIQRISLCHSMQANEGSTSKREVWDSNVITPGSVFMDKVSQMLSDYIETKLKKRDSTSKKVKFICSDSSVFGEGEHKILGVTNPSLFQTQQ